MFGTLLHVGDTVAKVYASPRNLTWFTRPFFLTRGDETSAILYTGCDNNSCASSAQVHGHMDNRYQHLLWLWVLVLTLLHAHRAAMLI